MSDKTEIEFRGLYHIEKDPFAGTKDVWVYGYYIKVDSVTPSAMSYDPEQAQKEHDEKYVKHYIVSDGFSDWNMPRELEWREVKLETVGQYSGLRDSKGKKIYEGDIVYIAGYGDYIAKFPFYTLYDASFENDIGEIRGNVHDNPELAKGIL